MIVAWVRAKVTEIGVTRRDSDCLGWGEGGGRRRREGYEAGGPSRKDERNEQERKKKTRSAVDMFSKKTAMAGLNGRGWCQSVTRSGRSLGAVPGLNEVGDQYLRCHWSQSTRLLSFFFLFHFFLFFLDHLFLSRSLLSCSFARTPRDQVDPEARTGRATSKSGLMAVGR